MLLAVVQTTNVAEYMKIANEGFVFKRRSIPVCLQIKLSPTEVLWLEVAEAAGYEHTCQEVKMKSEMSDLMALTSSGCSVCIGMTASLKQLFSQRPANWPVTFVDNAPGKITAQCKGYTLYYVRIMQITLKAGKMSEFTSCAQNLLAMTCDDEHTSQLVPFGDNCAYFVEINKPEHWEAVSQKYKDDSTFLSLAAASNECVESVKYFCYGAKPSDTCPLFPAGSSLLEGDDFKGWF